MLPLVQRTSRALSLWLAPAYGGNLRLVPDLDQVDALAPEREALWARVERTSFLSDAEKREAVGYGETGRKRDSSGDRFARKYREDQARDDQGRWTDEGIREETESELVPTQGRRGKQPQPVPPAKAPNEQPQYRDRKPGQSGKEAANDVPSYARGERPLVGENGDAFAKRVMDQKFPGQAHDTQPGSDFSKIKKYGDRAFK